VSQSFEPITTPRNVEVAPTIAWLRLKRRQDRPLLGMIADGQVGPLPKFSHERRLNARVAAAGPRSHTPARLHTRMPTPHRPVPYTTPTGPLHHTDRSTRGSHPRLCRSSSCVPILRASLVIRRAFSFSFPPASYSLSTLLSSGTVNGCADHEVPQEPARERRRGADGAIQWGRERRCIGRTMSVRSLLRTTCSEHALMLEAS